MAVADHAGFGLGILALGHKLAGEFAFRIVRTANEGAELAKPQSKSSTGTVGAAADQFAGVVLLEEMRAKVFVQHINDVGNPQFRSAVDGGLEILPELRQQLFPVELSVRYRVKLILEFRREIIFHIAAEEAVEEGHDQAAAVLGDEFATVLDHIVAVLQHLDDRCIGRRPPDAELFHRLDQAGVGEARWRLREMLFRRDLPCGKRFALVDGRQDGAVLRRVRFRLVGG